MRAVIVDDEPLARERIRTLLAEEQDVEIIGECEDGTEALGVLSAERPDLVFLDIQMPELDGFDVLEALPRDHRPIVVFITAYDEYAIQAFDVNAADYLLKPVAADRFREAMARARARRARPEAERLANLDALLGELRRLRGYADRLVARTGNAVTFVRSADVDWIDAQGNYARLHVGKTIHLLREPLRNLEKRLDPERFLRIHRGVIVNLERIATVEPFFHGEYVLTLQDGTRLTSSRTHSARLRTLLR